MPWRGRGVRYGFGRRYWKCRPITYMIVDSTIVPSQVNYLGLIAQYYVGSSDHAISIFQYRKMHFQEVPDKL